MTDKIKPFLTILRIEQETPLEVVELIFRFLFLCSIENFQFSFIQYLGVTAGVETVTLQCIPGALAY